MVSQFDETLSTAASFMQGDLNSNKVQANCGGDLALAKEDLKNMEIQLKEMKESAARISETDRLETEKLDNLTSKIEGSKRWETWAAKSWDADVKVPAVDKRCIEFLVLHDAPNFLMDELKKRVDAAMTHKMFGSIATFSNNRLLYSLLTRYDATPELNDETPGNTTGEKQYLVQQLKEMINLDETTLAKAKVAKKRRVSGMRKIGMDRLVKEDSLERHREDVGTFEELKEAVKQISSMKRKAEEMGFGCFTGRFECDGCGKSESVLAKLPCGCMRSCYVCYDERPEQGICHTCVASHEQLGAVKVHFESFKR